MLYMGEKGEKKCESDVEEWAEIAMEEGILEWAGEKEMSEEEKEWKWSILGDQGDVKGN